MWKSNKTRKPIQKGHQWVDGQKAHKMVLSGSQGISIRRQKEQTNISVISPQNNKWGFSPFPSLTPITSGKFVNYDTVTTYETVQIHQITSRNFNYLLANFLHKREKKVFFCIEGS
jgi:hypothetical protein